MRATSSTSARSDGAAPRELPATVLVGRILRPHGVRGELLVEPLSDLPDRLAPGSELLLEPAAGAAAGAQAGGGAATLTVTGSRPHRGALLVCFAGVDDRDAAAALRGVGLAVARDRVPPAPPGTYYHFELLGCRCRDRRDGDLGEVVDVVDDGGGLLLLVDDGSRRVPVPFVARFLRAVDVAAGTIEVELPPGLVEICASRS
jgi:16S rRNA processing protein RimM